MALPDSAFGPEWALLELLVIGLEDPDAESLFVKLIQSDELHWGETLHQALRHGMVTQLAFILTSDKYQKTIPTEILHHLHQVLSLNRHRTSILRREAARIARALRDRNIQFVGTKGIAQESTLYGGNGSRYMLDIDFMIIPKDREVVTEVMGGLGYQAATYDLRTDSVNAPTRKEIILHQLNPDHLFLFATRTGDPLVHYVMVDVANSLTWTNCPFDVPLEYAFKDIVYQSIPGYPDVELPSFSPLIQFLFTILHLFREAWLERWMSVGKDVNLSKFADVIRLWRVHGESMRRAGLTNRLEELGLIEPVVWVLEHLDRTFGTSIVREINLQGRVTEEYLTSARASGGRLRQWKGTMRERLQCKDRSKLFVDAPDQAGGDELHAVR
jgi:hypothetical protein